MQRSSRFGESAEACGSGAGRRMAGVPHPCNDARMWEIWVLAAAGLAAAIGGAAALRWWYRWMFVDSDAPPAPNDLVLLVEPANDMEAEVMRSKLDSFGVPALVKN